MRVVNRCSVCNHPDLKRVNKEIMDGTSYRTIAERHPPLTKPAVGRHSKKCFKYDSNAEYNKKRMNAMIDVYGEMAEEFKFAKSLRVAAQDYLSDPTDPLRINLTPRADEVEVIYYEVELLTDGDGNSEPKRIKKRATLAKLLQRVKDENPSLMLQSFQAQKKTDMRRYALECLQTSNTILDKFARIEGMYTKERENAQTIEKALTGLRLYIDKNPDASEEQLREAISIFARGVSISETILMERAGITFEVETIQ